MARKKITRSLLAVLSLTFLVVATATALILARGNSITPQGLLPTGTLRVTSNVSDGLSIFINEQKKYLSSNNTIEGLMPGEYSVKVEKDNYTSWQQKVVIRQGLVTDVSVQLFPKELKLSQVTTTDVDKSFYTPKREYVFYVVADSPLGANIGIWKQTLQQAAIPLIEERPFKITNLTNEINSEIQSGNYTIIPAYNNERIILKTSKDIYLINADKTDDITAQHKLIFSYPVDDISWLRGSTNLLITSGNLLIDYDLDKKTSTIIEYGVKSPIYTSSTESIIYTFNNQLYKYTPGTHTLIELENIVLPENITNIYTGIDNDKNIVLESKNKLYFLNTTESFLGEIGEYRLISISPSGRNLLLQDPDGKIKSLLIEISQTRDTVNMSTYSTGISNDLDEDTIIWDLNSRFFIYQSTKNSTSLFSADYTGNNINTILESAYLSLPGEYTISKEANGVLIKLLDEHTLEAGDVVSTTRSNIYKLSFE